jgi:hypothetical protein
MRDVDLISVRSVLALTWYIDELKNEGSPCNNATSSWEEVSSNDVFEY